MKCCKWLVGKCLGKVVIGEDWVRMCQIEENGGLWNIPPKSGSDVRYLSFDRSFDYLDNVFMYIISVGGSVLYP